MRAVAFDGQCRVTRKDGIEMGTHDHGGHVGRAWAAADDVAGGISVNVGERGIVKAALDPRAAFGFVARRCGDLCHRDLLVEDRPIARRKPVAGVG